MYVSDFLERLFPSIAPTRKLVGNLICEMGQKLPESLHESLESRLSYYSTKCMGYPAVWACARLLGIDEIQIDALIKKHQTALCISLSTSIIDELIDQESIAPSRDAIILYLLIYNSLDKNEWHKKDLGQYIFKESVNTANLFMDKLYKQRENPIYSEPDFGLKRIGNFHKMIAYDLTKDNEMLGHKKETIIDIVGLLGNWYAALDDFLDFEHDIENNIQTSYVQGILMKHFPHLSHLAEENPKMLVNEYNKHEHYTNIIIDALVELLSKIEQQIREFGTIGFADEIKNGTELLKECIYENFLNTRMK